MAKRLRSASGDVLEAEEGSLYPVLQRILIEGWATAEWDTSETGRRVRLYRLTPDGIKRLRRELREYEQASAAINAVLRLA